MLGRMPNPSSALHGAGVLADPLVAELVVQPLVAVLATHEPDGSIHAVPLWFAPGDGDDLLLATGAASRKVENLRRDPRATLTLHDSRPGCEVCGACLMGEAAVVDGEVARALVERVHERYVSTAGLELPEVVRFLASDDAAVRFRPVRAFTWDQRETAASLALRAAEAALPLVPTSPRPSGAPPVDPLQ
jgi:PPOX class probable F420-dependent enzyme